MSFNLPQYIWRGKTYKTIGGLHNAMLKLYPATSISFIPSWAVLRYPSNAKLHFARSIGEDGRSLIADIPEEHTEA